jgi:hypothetical protein
VLLPAGRPVDHIPTAAAAVPRADRPVTGGCGYDRQSEAIFGSATPLTACPPLPMRRA